MQPDPAHASKPATEKLRAAGAMSDRWLKLSPHPPLGQQEKRALDSSKALAVTNRGDRIRTCDLVLPKQSKRQGVHWCF